MPDRTFIFVQMKMKKIQYSLVVFMHLSTGADREVLLIYHRPVEYCPDLTFRVQQAII